MKIGMCVRSVERFEAEIEFARKHGFDFVKLWYDDNGLGVLGKGNIRIEDVARSSMPVVLHVGIKVPDIFNHFTRVCEIAEAVSALTVVIHPWLRAEHTEQKSNLLLAEGLQKSIGVFHRKEIDVALANNCRLFPVCYTEEQLNEIFLNNPGLDFFLDVAHTDDLAHSKALISQKRPSGLFVSDRRFSVHHEHLPAGEGNVDFQSIFNDLLPGFKGSIVIEIDTSDEDILRTASAVRQHKYSIA